MDEGLICDYVAAFISLMFVDVGNVPTRTAPKSNGGERERLHVFTDLLK